MGAAKSFQEILDQEINKNLDPNLETLQKPIDDSKSAESVFLKNLAQSLGRLSPSKIFVQKTYSANHSNQGHQKFQEPPKTQAPKPAEQPQAPKPPPPQRVRRTLTFDQTAGLKLFNSYGYKLDEWSTDAEIKKAYRMLAKKFHPDRLISASQNEKRSAEETFKSIARAFSHFDI